MNEIQKKLLETLGTEQAADILAKESARRQKTSDGKTHPFYAWRPNCAPWYPNSRVKAQEMLPKCRARKVALIGGNGSGKTNVMVEMAVGRAIGSLPMLELTWPSPQNLWVLTEPKLVDPLFERIVVQTPASKLLSKPYRSKGEQHLEFKNGSIIRMKSTGMDRSEFQMENVDAIYADEEPPKHILDECMARLRKKGSQMIYFFTPVDGTQYSWEEFHGFPESTCPECGQIHFEATDGEIAWFSASMLDNGELPEDYVASQKKRYANDPDQYAIRIEGKYVNLRGRCVFSEKALNRLREAMKPATEKVFWKTDGTLQVVEQSLSEHWLLWERPVAGCSYAIGADIAEGGLEGDFSAAHVLRVDTGRIVASYRGKTSPGDFGKDLALAGRFYNKALIAWEMNMQGAAVYDRLSDLAYPRLYRNRSFSAKIDAINNQWGFRTTGPSKRSIVSNLNDALSEGALVVHDEATLAELRQFGWLRKESGAGRTYGMGAMSGHDDTVMALAITWEAASQVNVTQPRVGDEADPMKAYIDKMYKQAGRTERDSRKTGWQRYSIST